MVGVQIEGCWEDVPGRGWRGHKEDPGRTHGFRSITASPLPQHHVAGGFSLSLLPQGSPLLPFLPVLAPQGGYLVTVYAYLLLACGGTHRSMCWGCHFIPGQLPPLLPF